MYLSGFSACGGFLAFVLAGAYASGTSLVSDIHLGTASRSWFGCSAIFPPGAALACITPLHLSHGLWMFCLGFCFVLKLRAP